MQLSEEMREKCNAHLQRVACGFSSQAANYNADLLLILLQLLYALYSGFKMFQATSRFENNKHLNSLLAHLNAVTIQ